MTNEVNSLYSNLKFIAKNLIFENPNELLGKFIIVDQTSPTLEHDIQSAINQISNFETTLEKTEQRKLAIKKYGILDLTFEIRNFNAQHSKNSFQILRNEQVLQENEFTTIEERKEAREMMSFMLEDDIKSMKEGKLCLKIFAEARNGFTSQHNLFHKVRNNALSKNPQNPDVVEFEITDACITNLQGIWFNKHFYW